MLRFLRSHAPSHLCVPRVSLRTILRFLRSHAPFYLSRYFHRSDTPVEVPDPAAARPLPEIWFRIADMLPLAQVERLAPLNRVFLDVAMSHQYRAIHADVDDCHRFDLSIGQWSGRKPVHPSAVLNGRARHLLVEDDSMRIACNIRLDIQVGYSV
ncbi:hypothetical protein BDV98DRAFT_109211 [Pterulicium gracile]|uniref:F-box domain-containing protein n=1 Tax=Pterulicium gracile TaxID=1884261 RepID=A0A5C3QG57_9AGAR|nr:hypothetical protein BDV98DRAFT_109211 [Pterula gracilis]